MPTPSLKSDVLRQAADYVRAAMRDGYLIGGIPSAKQEAARRMVADRVMENLGGATTRVREAVIRGYLDGDPAEPTQPQSATADEPAPEPVETRQEIRDAAFWRLKAKALEKDLAEAEHIARELAGVRSVPVSPPAWIVRRSPERNRAVIGCLLSDLHCGEVVRADEIEGVNAYDVDVFRARLRRYVSAVINIAPRWLEDCEPAGCLLALGGDLISGDIHEELRITNALTAHEQVQVCVEELTAAIRLLADAFGLVHVPCVPGNHGRTTPKPTAKLSARLSYDTMIGAMLADRFAEDPRVTFDVATGPDILMSVLGWNVLLTHGDRLGTGGGQGFAGPFLPIVRGAKKVMHQHATMKRPFDLLMTGHFHSSGQPGAHLSNGSMVGYSEYPSGIRAGVEPPMQWAFLLHSRWMLRDRAEIKLEDLTPPAKPRIRVPAAMAAA